MCLVKVSQQSVLQSESSVNRHEALPQATGKCLLYSAFTNHLILTQLFKIIYSEKRLM